MAWLTAVSKVFDNPGAISIASVGKDQGNMGVYSNTDLRQKLVFTSKAALEEAAELAPYSVRKHEYFETVSAWEKLPVRSIEARMQLYDSVKGINNTEADDHTFDTVKVTPEWLAGLYDGEGCADVQHHRKAGRSKLRLHVTQSKCHKLLIAIKEVNPGNRINGIWKSRKTSPPVYLALDKYLVMKKQKLDTLLRNLFQFDLTKNPIKGSGHAGAFFCVTLLCCQRAGQPCAVESIYMGRCYPGVSSVIAVWCYRM